jgi:signal transduction histidine kinase/PAS domain-containing protein/ActR/RegA family two-component response regulator
MENQTESIVDHEKTVDSVENHNSSLNQGTFEGLIARALKQSTTEQELFGSLAEYLAAQGIGLAIADIQEENSLHMKALFAPNGTNLTSRITPRNSDSSSDGELKLMAGFTEDLDAGRVLFMSTIDELLANYNGELEEAFLDLPVMMTRLPRANSSDDLLILCGSGLSDKWLAKGEELAERLSMALDILRVKTDSIREPVCEEEQINGSKSGVLITNSQGTIKDANQRTLELLNCTEEEILGRSINEVLPDRQDLIDSNQTTIKGSAAVIKVDQEDLDESVRYLHIETQPVSIEGEEDVLFKLCDLTDHWRQAGTGQLTENSLSEIPYVPKASDGSTQSYIESDLGSMDQKEDTLQELVREILAESDLAQVVQRTLRGVSDLFSCQFACLSRFDLQKLEVHLLGELGGDGGIDEGQILPLQSWEGSSQLSKGETVYYSSIQELKLATSFERTLFEQGMNSVVSQPLNPGNEDLWILSLGDPELDLLTKENQVLLRELQPYVSKALNNAKWHFDTSKRVETYQDLYACALEIGAETELIPLLKTSLKWTTDLLEATMGAIFLVEEATDEITLITELNLPVPPSVLRLRKGQGLAGRIWEKQKAVILNKVRDLGDPRWLEGCYATGSAIGVPLNLEGKVVGVLTLYNPGKGNQFGHDEAALLGKLAAQISLGIMNFQKHEKVNRRVNQLRVVNDLARRVSAILIEDLLFSDIVRRVAHGLNLELVVLFLVKGRDLIEAASYFLPADMHGNWEPIRLRIGKDGISGLVASEGKPVVTSNVSNDPNYLSILPIKTQIQSAVGIPLKLKGKVTGVLFAGSHKLAAFDQADVEGLQTLGAHISTCIENARLYEETKEVQFRLAESEKLRALGLMTGGVAQDFNNMLSIIYAQSKLALDRTEDNAIQSHLQKVINSVEGGRSAVRRLNDFAHTPKDTSDFVGVDLNLVVKEAIELSRTRWVDQAKQDNITIDIVSDLYADGFILGSPDELREVFINLILNSVEAMPNGGTIAIQTFSKADGVILTVADTGVGMTSESKEKVFMPFYSTKPGKAGLGLSMGYGVVQRHGGTIEVLSKAGEGTTVKVWLPIFYDVDIRGEHPDILKYPALVEPVTILVVEDEDAIREGLVDTFRNAGHKVLSARNGLEGFERYLEAGKMDVVFTDLGMPKLSGWELIEQLRAFDQNLPIVILSAWADEVDPMKLEHFGITKVLGKPFEMARLHLVLEEVLDLGPKEDPPDQKLSTD